MKLLIILLVIVIILLIYLRYNTHPPLYTKNAQPKQINRCIFNCDCDNDNICLYGVCQNKPKSIDDKIVCNLTNSNICLDRHLLKVDVFKKICVVYSYSLFHVKDICDMGLGYVVLTDESLYMVVGNDIKVVDKDTAEQIYTYRGHLYRLKEGKIEYRIGNRWNRLEYIDGKKITDIYIKKVRVPYDNSCISIFVDNRILTYHHEWIEEDAVDDIVYGLTANVYIKINKGRAIMYRNRDVVAKYNNVYSAIVNPFKNDEMIISDRYGILVIKPDGIDQIKGEGRLISGINNIFLISPEKCYAI
jgi:hypothetical protein